MAMTAGGLCGQGGSGDGQVHLTGARDKEQEKDMRKWESIFPGTEVRDNCTLNALLFLSTSAHNSSKNFSVLIN